MKNVYVVAGNTYPKKEDLKSMYFRYLPGNKIWVKWASPYDESIKQIELWENVGLFQTIHDPFVGTCVDPLRGDKAITKSTYDWTLDLSESNQQRLKSLYGVKVKSTPKPKVHPWNGKQAELNKYAAKSVQEKVNEMRSKTVDYLYRNIRIVEVVRETAKAVQVKIEFFGGIARSCHVCGSALDTEISRSCGIGPVCARKMGLPRPNANNASIILAQIEEMAGEIGEIGPVWVPKSCIEILN